MPTLLNEFCAFLTLYVPAINASALGLTSQTQLKEMSTGGIIGRLVVCGVMLLTCFVTLQLPAYVALTRIQASMLPEEDEAIVAFDRSFGGRFEPRIVGGAGALGLKDAWYSFDKASRLRLLKLTGKILAIDIGLSILFGLLLGGEVAALFHTATVTPRQPPSF